MNKLKHGIFSFIIATQLRQLNRAGERIGPGHRTILNMRPSHPGKPREYFQRDTIPKHLRRAA